MKLLVILAISFVILNLALGLKLDFHHADTPHKDCASHGTHGHEGHFPHENIEKLNKGELIDANCPEYTQHLLCIWKERGVMNEEGILQKDVIISKVSRITGDNTVDQQKVKDCAVQKGTPGETATAFYNCVAPLVKKYNS